MIYAPFAAAMVYGSLADAVRVYRETCETTHKRPMRRAMCSYFVHIASTPAEEQYGKEALVRYFQDALIAAFPSSSGEKVPPTYKYFVDIVNILRDMRPEKLTDKSILCGSPQHIVDTLKQVEKAGIAEVILYFNYGQKPHAMVKEQMERFMREVAPHFDGVASPLRDRHASACAARLLSPLSAEPRRRAHRHGVQRGGAAARRHLADVARAGGAARAGRPAHGRPVRHHLDRGLDAHPPGRQHGAEGPGGPPPRRRATHAPSCCMSRRPAGASPSASCRSPSVTRRWLWPASMPAKPKR